MSKADRILRRRSDGWSARQAIHSSGKIGRSLQTEAPPDPNQTRLRIAEDYEEALRIGRDREEAFMRALGAIRGGKSRSSVMVLVDELYGTPAPMRMPFVQRKTKSERREERKQQIAYENRQRQYESSSLF